MRRLLLDNLAMEKDNGQQNHWLPLWPLWISRLGSDTELLVMVLSNQPSLMLVLLGITLERTDCLLLSV